MGWVNRNERANCFLWSSFVDGAKMGNCDTRLTQRTLMVRHFRNVILYSFGFPVLVLLGTYVP